MFSTHMGATRAIPTCHRYRFIRITRREEKLPQASPPMRSLTDLEAVKGLYPRASSEIQRDALDLSEGSRDELCETYFRSSAAVAL